MLLNVVKYINYGWVLTGGDDKFYEDRFYWSFYELNNKNIIELQLFETVENDITKFSEYTFNYPCYELKNDLQIKYKFGQDFYKWFDSIPPFSSVKFSLANTGRELSVVIPRIVSIIYQSAFPYWSEELLEFLIINH